MKLSERDKKFIWHPFTQEKTANLPIAITKGSGSYLYDENNKAYLDLISSWWVNLHGHANPKIAKAIYEQAITLEHVIFAGFTHEPAVKVCEQLKDLLPQQLSKFFFSDNGSTSVEVALKMAYQYWWNLGNKERTTFLSFAGGYHGDTFGAMSVGSASGFHDPFAKLFFSVLTIPFPATWHEDSLVDHKENQALDVLKNYLHAYGLKIAAIILEPLVQGARGMKMCRSKFINEVVNLVRSHGILIIFDEVMTNFGRTGSNFAFEQTKVIPDFLCIAKGLTGGFLPLALTITSESIYNAFLGDHFSAAFAHGHSYTANPLGCAAAIASLELLEQEGTLTAIKAINVNHQKNILHLLDACSDKIKHARVLGTIAAFDINFKMNDKNQKLMTTLIERLIKQGLLIRPLGNTIYLLPPYSTTTSELDESYEKIKFAITNLN